MIQSIAQLPVEATRWQRLKYQLAAIPWHGLRHNGNQALITFGAMYAGAMFNMQHNVFPWWVAFPLAIGFEWTYLAGIALANDVRRGFWSVLVNTTAMLTSAVFGMLFVLGIYNAIPEHPDQITAAWLAAAHIIPITLMSFFYAMAHRAHRAQYLADKDLEDARRQAADDQQKQLEYTYRSERLQIELERERLQLLKEQNRINRAFAPIANNTKPCPKCGSPLTAGQYSVAHRYGHCKTCKDT
jgi:hypothetical protein